MMMCKGHIITIHMQTMHMFPHMSCSQTYRFFIYNENVTSKNDQTLFVSQFTMTNRIEQYKQQRSEFGGTVGE